MEISQAYGLTLHELMRRMSARELYVRVTHAMVQKGWTFQSEQVEAIRKREHSERIARSHERVLAAARAEWSKQRG